MSTPKKSKMKGWVPVASQPKRSKSQAADVKGASIQKLNAKSGGDSAPAKPRGASKLHAEYFRPENGLDSDAKLFILDSNDEPRAAQG